MLKDRSGNIWLGLHNGKIVQWNKAKQRFISSAYASAEDSIAGILAPLVSRLLEERPGRSFILIGRGSTEFRLKMMAENPALKERIHATGEVAAAEVSRWIRRCDLMVQPYPDGVSGRRTTAMVALSHGVPLITNRGLLTEDVWAQSGAILLLSCDTTQFVDAVDELLIDDSRRRCMALRGRTFYLNRFDLRHTIRALRSRGEPQPALCES